MKIIEGILKFMEDSADIFGRYPDIDRYVEGCILSVHSGYRSYGIGSKLFRALFDLCREHNAVLKVFCSSIFTAKICEKFGMELIFAIPYADVRLGNLPRLNVPEPHTIGRDFCIDLRNSK